VSARWTVACASALLACALTAGTTRAEEPLRAHAGITPAVLKLGERGVYRGWVAGTTGARGWIRIQPPEPNDDLTWGEPSTWSPAGGWSLFGQRHRKTPDAQGRFTTGGWDTVFVEVPVQFFRYGRFAVPGLQIEVSDGRASRLFRLPMVNITVVPTVTASDSNARFREVHGPLAAPWYERVPWTWVALGVALLAAIVAAIAAWRRRGRGPAIPGVAAPSTLEPAAEALAALAALRARHLPEHGQFIEHAFALGRLLRRFLERTTETPRPGDSTPELVRHLEQGGLSADDVKLLADLLRVWDRVKFAREPFTLEEAIRAERASESFIRRTSTPAAPVAAASPSKVA
jgi:hypothetical protein